MPPYLDAQKTEETRTPSALLGYDWEAFPWGGRAEVLSALAATGPLVPDPHAAAAWPTLLSTSPVAVQVPLSQLRDHVFSRNKPSRQVEEY